MESVESTSSAASFIPFKSKKPLLTTTPQKTQPPQVGPTIATPDRVNPTHRRIRNQHFALSISDVRRAALKLRKPNLSEPISRSGRATQKPIRVGHPAAGSDPSTASLPEQYEMLCEFFFAMVSSIRLLRLKRLPATLSKLSRNIESLTDRRFTMRHLGQLKHLVPEVIVVKKIRVQDEETGCMKEEFLVSLDADAVEADKNAEGSGGFAHLKEIFQTRINDFATAHPEGDDVPEGELPELFYKPKQEPERTVEELPAVLPASLTSHSFKKRFSSRARVAPVSESFLAKPSSSLPETPVKETTDVMTEEKTVSETFEINATPAKLASTPAKCDWTPAEVISTPARLMAATPALRTPKRSLTSTDDVSFGLPTKSNKRRALTFEESSDEIEDQLNNAGSDEDGVQVQHSAASQDLLKVLPENLVHSLMVKEQRILEEQNPVVSQARRRQQLMAGVPKLFDMIRILFQSIKRSVMTREELIYKVISGHLDIVDREEVEEQLQLLQEVAPEFLCEQLSISGDTLFRVNKSSCADTIRAKLLEAQ